MICQPTEPQCGEVRGLLFSLLLSIVMTAGRGKLPHKQGYASIPDGLSPKILHCCTTRVDPDADELTLVSCVYCQIGGGFAHPTQLTMNNFPYKLAIVNQLSESQLDESVMMCIRGYVDSPSVDVMTGGNKSLEGPLFRAMIRACQLAGRVYIATVIDTGAIAGLALWFPPGKVLWQNDAQRNLGFDQFLESLSPKTREWWINTYSGPALAPFIETALSPHTVESSWYLNCICVDPKCQRQGIATNLIKMVEQQAMTTSILALCTDTDDNVAVYKALHFQYKGEAPLPTPEDEYINVHCFTKPGARV
ncbi:hypothetical protein F4604DRAFT_1726134 [Suillus subluteus]|nr:hypothetical protein F4604DRAFT_1814408 [Suillus subluteus]KAG1885438.1 hypothetical protein F4604DRAFT_1726134 [Suillus subluteus]